MPPEISNWPNDQNHLISVTWLSGKSNYTPQFAIWNVQIANISWFLSPGWVGNLITLFNFPSEISKLPKLPEYCHPVEWAIQLPNQFSTSNIQIHKITRLLLPNWVGNQITQRNLPSARSKLPKLPDFCHQVEWTIQLSYPICYLISPNCQNYPISLTRLSGRSNHPTQFAT